jgi:hypothetical protein
MSAVSISVIALVIARIIVHVVVAAGTPLSVWVLVATLASISAIAAISVTSFGIVGSIIMPLRIVVGASSPIAIARILIALGWLKGEASTIMDGRSSVVSLVIKLSSEVVWMIVAVEIFSKF